MNSFLFLLTPILNNLKFPMELSLNHLCDNVNRMAELVASEASGDFKEFK